MALKVKQLAFVKYYILHKNATKAAKLAGYSLKTAEKIGSENLHKPEIARAIAQSIDRANKKVDLTAEAVLAEIRKLAFVNLSHAYGVDGELLHPHNMPEDVQASLQSVEADEIFSGRGSNKHKIGVTKKIKLADKVRSLEMLARHFKLLTDITQLQNPDGGPLVVLTMPANGSESEKKPT